MWISRWGWAGLAFATVSSAGASAQDAPDSHRAVEIPLGGTLHVPVRPPGRPDAVTAAHAGREGDRRRERRSAPAARPEAARSPRAVPAQVAPTPLDRGVASTRAHVEATTVIPRIALGGVPHVVAEPSLGAFGRDGMLVTGNSFGSVSFGGRAYEPFDLDRAFPGAVGTRVVDPVVLSKPGLDLVVAYVQLRTSDERDAGAALLAATGAELTSRTLRFYRLSPELFGATGWVDYPDLAFSDGFLHWTALLVEGSSVTSPVWARFPIEALRSGARTLVADWTVPVDRASVRLAQGCGDEMFAAAHESDAALRVLRWPDGGGPTSHVVDVDPWSGTSSRWTSVAPASGGRDWLHRLGEFGSADITAGWCRAGPTGTEIGFAWNVAADDEHPQPHVRAVVLDSTLARKRQPHLWSRDVAFAYPAAQVDGRGRLGFAVAFGGGAHAPGVAVGTEVEPTSSATPPWELHIAAEGTHGPASEHWGDFLVVRALATDPAAARFATVAWTLRGGESDENVEVSVAPFTLR
ncbi:MAG: hypothetical protein IT460_12430 [Planctomycetes bacterium]|nr:hypothetical protein [Planctomycetota bacterium]